MYLLNIRKTLFSHPSSPSRHLDISQRMPISIFLDLLGVISFSGLLHPFLSLVSAQQLTIKIPAEGILVCHVCPILIGLSTTLTKKQGSSLNFQSYFQSFPKSTCSREWGLMHVIAFEESKCWNHVANVNFNRNHVVL